MSPLLTLKFWFNLHAVPFIPAMERVLAVVFGVLVLGGILAGVAGRMRRASKEWKRALGMLSSHLFWTGAIGLMLWFFNEQWVPILSMRFFFVLWAVWFAWGFYPIYRYLWVEVPDKLQMHQERIEREKWFPKKKK